MTRAERRPTDHDAGRRPRGGRPVKRTGDPWLDGIRFGRAGTNRGFAYRPNELIVDRRPRQVANGDLELGLEARTINSSLALLVDVPDPVGLARSCVRGDSWPR